MKEPSQYLLIYLHPLKEIIKGIMMLKWKRGRQGNGYERLRIFAFDLKILSSDIVKNSPLPLLFFGGISNPKIAEKVLQDKKTAAIAIGNFLSYRENSIEYFKRTINNALLRRHHFK